MTQQAGGRSPAATPARGCKDRRAWLAQEAMERHLRLRLQVHGEGQRRCHLACLRVVAWDTNVSRAAARQVPSLISGRFGCEAKNGELKGVEAAGGALEADLALDRSPWAPDTRLSLDLGAPVRKTQLLVLRDRGLPQRFSESPDACLCHPGRVQRRCMSVDAVIGVAVSLTLGASKGHLHCFPGSIQVPCSSVLSAANTPSCL